MEDKILPKIPSFGKLPGFKRVPYDAILDAAKYASWLDYSKYWVLSRLADDPPDPNFTSLAKPPALRGIPHSVPALGDAKAREVALYVALLTTVERAAGARAAGDTNATTAQLRHASTLSNRLVTLLGTGQRALTKAAKVVDQMPALRLPRGLVKRAAPRLDTPASSTFERKALAKLGFTTERIKSVRVRRARRQHQPPHRSRSTRCSASRPKRRSSRASEPRSRRSRISTPLADPRQAPSTTTTNEGPRYPRTLSAALDEKR